MAIRVERAVQAFRGKWRLAPLAATACKVEFFLRYEFQSAVMAKFAGPVFDNIANTLVDAYVRRAEQVLGGKAAGRSD
jgi:ribosome-associated toxin RatA of RatAB toxin-antitoxin module